MCKKCIRECPVEAIFDPVHTGDGECSVSFTAPAAITSIRTMAAQGAWWTVHDSQDWSTRISRMEFVWPLLAEVQTSHYNSIHHTC